MYSYIGFVSSVAMKYPAIMEMPAERPELIAGSRHNLITTILIMPVISTKLRARLLDALAHPNRIRILEAIRSGHTCSCEIAPDLNLEQSNLSRHMKILVDRDILIPERDGVRINYRIADEDIFKLLDMAGQLIRRNAERSILEEAE